MGEKHQFTRSIVVKDRTGNKVVARYSTDFFVFAKAMVEHANRAEGKKRFHWYESNEPVK
jgi:hypothetical protein